MQNANNVLHLLSRDKFTWPFIKFVEYHFKDTEQFYFVISGLKNFAIERNNRIKIIDKNINLLSNIILIHNKLYNSDKIIIHGLCHFTIIVLLFLQPWLLNKCYWVILGDDLYTYRYGKRDLKWKIKEFFRRKIIKNMGHLVTYVEGDVDLARQWYGTKGQYHECLMYPSNLYKEYDVPQKEHTTIHIQVGNSADPSNNHLEVFEKLIPYKEQDIKIFVPLSYGEQAHAKKVIEVGVKLFGDKFVPLTAFMPFDHYLEFMGQIDIAVFNHKRQQGMGNIITLLGLGKKVYMRNDVTPWMFFNKRCIKVFDVDELQLTFLPNDVKENNRLKLMEYFSESCLNNQLEELFR